MKRTILGFSAVLACLTLLAQEKSRPAGSGLAERFKQLDRNGDGRLSREEAGSAPFFKAADTDGDGFVSFAEAEVHSRQSAGPARNRTASMEGDGAGPMTSRVKPVEISEVESPIRTLDAKAADGRDVRAVLRKPKGDGPFPAIAFIHGGLTQFPEEVLRRQLTVSPVVTRMLAAGYAVVQATFRTYERDVRAFLDQAMPAAARPRASAGAPAWVTPAVTAPRVQFNTFDSAAAKTKVSYHLYTPAIYDEEPARRFPVLYWLHGSGGGLSGIPQLARHFDTAITGRKAPPFLVVFVNGLVEGMYVDWKDGSVPLETVIVKDLVPHVDATWRTVDAREGRALDGFSMGGYGAARLGFKYPELFRAVSIVGAGPMQPELVQAPRAGRQRAAEVLRKVYGGDQAYFRTVSPRMLARQNAETIAKGSLVRIVIGDKDETFENNRGFHDYLAGLGIPHTWTVLPGVAHDPMGVLNAQGDTNWAFYRAAFGGVDAPVPTVPASSPGDKYLLWVEGMDHGFGGVSGLKDGLYQFQRNADHILYTKMVTLAFWDAHLKGDAQAKAWLASDALASSSKGIATIEHK